MTGQDDKERCRKVAARFINQLLGELRRGKIPAIEDVVALFEGFVSSGDACSLNLELRSVFEAAAKMALDASMEALSVHMEDLDEETYAQLSSSLVRYAFHVARLASEALAGHLDPSLIEPLLFVALSRLLALSEYIKQTPTEKLGAETVHIAALVEAFIEEEENYLRGLLYTLGAGVAGAQESQR